MNDSEVVVSVEMRGLRRTNIGSVFVRMKVENPTAVVALAMPPETAATWAAELSVS